MCGIAGFMDTKHQDPSIINTMLDEIKHRGPDGHGTYHTANGYLGHCRLSIIDLATGGQPMFSQDKNLVLVFNGEIYNYLEIKEELSAQGYTFQTTSDSEVLLVGYQAWGENLVDHLRGMYAFVIYDVQNDQYYGARDHFGIKPFYYYHGENSFIFASEAKAILKHPDYHLELDKELLPLYLRFNYVPVDKTMFKGIHRLEAGTCFTYRQGKLSLRKYFRMEMTGEGTTKEEIQKTMKNSVDHHLLSDVKVGSFLSSGIDSSYLVSLSKVQDTYTIGYHEKKYSELEYAKDLCNKLGIENHKKIITKEEYFKSLRDAVYHLDEPLADPSAISLYHVAKRASEDVKVVLSGEGADEFFGGYNTYNQISAYDKVPYVIRHAIGSFASLFPPFRGRNFLVRKGRKIEDGYIGVNSVFSEKEMTKITKVKNPMTNKEISRQILKGYEDLDDVSKMQIVDIRLWLEKDIFTKADRMTMASSIEGRVPFSDFSVYQTARKLTLDEKLHNGTTKYLLREASRDVIPTEAYNKKKLGFPVPLREWIKYDDVKADILKALEMPIASELFDVDYVKHLIEDHCSGKHDNYKKIWCVYIFLLWYQIYFTDEKAA